MGRRERHGACRRLGGLLGLPPACCVPDALAEALAEGHSVPLSGGGGGGSGVDEDDDDDDDDEDEDEDEDDDDDDDDDNDDDNDDDDGALRGMTSGFCGGVCFWA